MWTLMIAGGAPARPKSTSGTMRLTYLFSFLTDLLGNSTST
jgi:hypothetical protein